MNTVISKDGTPIAYERTGTGPALILVDGALCSLDFGPMPKLAPLLAGDFTVLSYDRRGRGGSGDTAPYAVAREVEDLQALIEAAGGSAHVLGLSSGAVLAIEAAASGLAINRLALYEPPFMVSESGHRPPADHQAQLQNLIAQGRNGDAVIFFITRIVGMPKISTWPMRLLPMWKKLKAVAPTLRYDAAIMGDYSLPRHRLAAVRMPTLVASGEKSPEILRLAARAAAGGIPGAQHRELKGQTHNVSPPVLAALLREFLKG